MKLNAKNKLIILALILFCSTTIQAQKKLLAASDKAQIAAAILRKEDFFEDDAPSEAKKKKEVYLLADNISSKYLPRIKNVKLILLSRNRIERMKKTGVEYYSFSRFKVIGKVVRVKFAKDYVALDAEYASGKSTNFKCRKVAKRWSVNAVSGRGYVSEKSGL
ncbi:MAG TPA: hypothetical protein VF556_16390 [Pyrinomonadaceae bacterium]|jgi:hypothetical protein